MNQQGRGAGCPPCPPPPVLLYYCCATDTAAIHTYMTFATHVFNIRWTSRTGGLAAPLAPRYQFLCCCTAMNPATCWSYMCLYLLHVQQCSCIGGVKGGSQPPCLTGPATECVCVLLLYVLHEQQHSSTGGGGQGGAVSPPASQVQQLNVCVLLLYVLHEQQHSRTGGGVQGGQSAPLPHRSSN